MEPAGIQDILRTTAAFLSLVAGDAAIAKCLQAASASAIASLRNGGTIYICGNGGSASQATHFAGELVGAFYDRARKPFAAVPLGFDTASQTSIANDFGFEQVYARQLEGLGRKGDVLWALSTSGNSPSILAALRKAKDMNIHTVLFTNHDGGAGAGLANCVLRTPEGPTPRVQEAHLVYGHLLCEKIEKELTGVN